MANEPEVASISCRGLRGALQPPGTKHAIQSSGLAARGRTGSTRQLLIAGAAVLAERPPGWLFALDPLSFARARYEYWRGPALGPSAKRPRRTDVGKWRRNPSGTGVAGYSQTHAPRATSAQRDFSTSAPPQLVGTLDGAQLAMGSTYQLPRSGASVERGRSSGSDRRHPLQAASRTQTCCCMWRRGGASDARRYHRERLSRTACRGRGR